MIEQGRARWARARRARAERARARRARAERARARRARAERARVIMIIGKTVKFQDLAISMSSCSICT